MKFKVNFDLMDRNCTQPTRLPACSTQDFYHILKNTRCLKRWYLP